LPNQSELEKIHFRKYGKGHPVILLHGFPMNQKVWEPFASKLSSSFSVYTPDLPGFGNSLSLPEGFTLQDVAEVMVQWIRSLSLAKVAVIGHSMGGYVALEMAKKTGGQFSGLGLFHSTALTDSVEKKESRTKVIRFIDENGVLAFTSNFIQPLFADQNHAAIPFVRSNTMEASAEAVKGYTKAMRDREDNRQVLINFGKPVLLIGGDEDKGIPAESLREQSKLSADISLSILDHTGHMGMFEKEDETLMLVRNFLGKIYQPDKA
jgi:pimeloyl-ACP methyl ester carboxylesterase